MRPGAEATPHHAAAAPIGDVDACLLREVVHECRGIARIVQRILSILLATMILTILPILYVCRSRVAGR
ncbi:hypothetical protein [Cupriavidus pauculus]|uniref:hypothetical protein n=1 Tax=Cupriavidus pauculus TaxID=82633 RepID=UPI00385738AB